MKTVELKSLSDLIHDEPLILYQDYRVVISSVKDVISILVKANWIDDIEVDEIPDFGGNTFNREYRSWRQSLIDSTRISINQLSSLMNEQGLLAPPNYDDMPNIKLALPQTLSFDKAYRDLMNDNIKLLETRINDFYKILEDAGLTTD